jgi:hypothetical protein
MEKRRVGEMQIWRNREIDIQTNVKMERQKDR